MNIAPKQSVLDGDKVKETLGDFISREAQDPFGLNTIIDAWNNSFDEEPTPGPSTALSEACEPKIGQALDALTDEQSAGVNAKIAEVINALPFPAFVYSAEGEIISVNDMAFDAMGTLPGGYIDELGYKPPEGGSLLAVLAEAFAEDTGENRMRILNAKDAKTDQGVILILLKSKIADTHHSLNLLFVAVTLWTYALEEELSLTYGVSPTELEVLKDFLNGNTLQKIAEKRGKSVGTIKLQFHSIYGKLGVSGQVDLIRKIVLLTHFMQSIKSISRLTNYPHRKKVNLLRPGGRTVEAFLSGDVDGDVVISIPSFSTRTYAPSIEKRFAERGICMATLVRPGCGATDRALPGQNKEGVFKQDTEALLDRLGAQRAVVVAHGTACFAALKLATQLPNRVKKLVFTSVFPPLSYIRVDKKTSPIIAAIVRAHTRSPKLFRLLLHFGYQTWKLGGIMGLHASQTPRESLESHLFRDPFIREELDAAIKSLFAQSRDGAYSEILLVQEDWEPLLKQVKCPIEILHGELDTVGSIGAIRKLVDDYPDKLNLTEIKEIGSLIPYCATSQFLDALDT